MQNRTCSIPQKSPERKLKLNPHSCASPNQSPFLPPSSHRTPARYNALYTLHLTTTAKAPRVAALSHSRACDKDYTLSPQASSRGRPAVRKWQVELEKDAHGRRSIARACAHSVRAAPSRATYMYHAATTYYRGLLRGKAEREIFRLADDLDIRR